MNWDAVSKISLAVLPIVAAVVSLIRGRGGRRNQIKQDAELLGLLPEGTAARERLLHHLDQSIAALGAEEQELTRDLMGIGLGVIFLGGAIATFVLAIQGSGWWWFIVALLLIIGIAGLSESAAKAKRDNRGRRIRAAKGPEQLTP